MSEIYTYIDDEKLHVPCGFMDHHAMKSLKMNLVLFFLYGILVAAGNFIFFSTIPDRFLPKNAAGITDSYGFIRVAGPALLVGLALSFLAANFRAFRHTKRSGSHVLAIIGEVLLFVLAMFFGFALFDFSVGMMGFA